MDASLPRPHPATRQGLAGAARFAGPGLLVSVGYMDPGNWATDIEAGSRYGYALLFVVALSSMAALYLQTRAARLGLVTGRDLAQLCRARYSRPATLALWAGAEVAIIACDIAEVLGAALALKLLLHLPLWAGVLLTGLDTLIVLVLQGRGMRRLEAAVLALVVTIAAAFVVELAFFPPDWSAAAHGLLPTGLVARDPHALYLAIGIVGATVMPHNLYLHSALVRARPDTPIHAALRWTTLDVAAALGIASWSTPRSWCSPRAPSATPPRPSPRSIRRTGCSPRWRAPERPRCCSESRSSPRAKARPSPARSPGR